MSGGDLTPGGTVMASLYDTTPIPTPTRAQVDAARAHVIRHATSPADRDDLLGVLGLGGRIRRQVTTLACGHPSTESARGGISGDLLCRACQAERRTR